MRSTLRAIWLLVPDPFSKPFGYWFLTHFPSLHHLAESSDMDIQIGNPNSLWLLTVVAAGLVLTGYAIIARRRAVLRFATARLQNRILPPCTTSRHWMSALLIGGSMTLLCLAIMDIRWGKTWREVPQKGIEVMFVLDVSRSMLAEDATPNRLSRARQQIKDMVDEMAGDRVGLVVFAGDTRQSVPLTSHYDDFIQTLDSVGPHSVSVGGSRLGDAIKAAANGFISKTNGHKSIVVFTDGEDQESQPIEIAKQIHLEQGIRIFTVGLGDTDQGARIPETDARRGGFVQYEGQQVWSKMNGQILSQIATDTDGAYIPAGTRRVNMADVYHGYVANVEQTEFETAKINTYTVRFQWFAAPALALLLLEVWLSTRSTNNESKHTMTSSIYKRLFHSSVALVVIAIASDPASAQSSLNAGETAREINAANELLREGRVDEALEAFGRVVPGDQQRDELNYNMAVAEYRNGNIDAAEKLFGEVAGAGNPAISSNSRYNLGNCRYTKAVQVAVQDRPAAIGHLRDAVAHYRGALRANSNNPDARANIELAGAFIRKLEQEQKQQEEQKKQEQEKQDKSHEDQQKDQGESTASDKSENDEQKKDAEKEEMPEDETQKPDDQKSPGEESQPSHQKPSEQQTQPKASDGKQTQPQTMQQQSADQEQPDDERMSEEEESKNQPVPAGDLKAAGQPGEKTKPVGSGAMADLKAEDGLMTREEALKLLQSVRDRDMLRRIQQQRQERSRHVPVNRDW